MKKSFAILALTISSVTFASPNKAMDYKPSDLGEKVASAVLNVNSDENGFECEIGLASTGAINIGAAVGEVHIERFMTENDPSVQGVPIGLNVESTPEFKELQRIANRVTVSNKSTPLQGPIPGYFSFGFRVRDDEPDALAYDADFFMKHPSGFQTVVTTPENARAVALINSLCNSARLEFNKLNPAHRIPSLSPIAKSKQGNETKPQPARKINRINQFFSRFF